MQAYGLTIDEHIFFSSKKNMKWLLLVCRPGQSSLPFQDALIRNGVAASTLQTVKNIFSERK